MSRFISDTIDFEFIDEQPGIVERMIKALDLDGEPGDITIKAGFDPNQSRNADGTWGSGVDKITVYRGRGRNYAEGENEGFLWVATNKETASNYAEWDEDGNPLVDEWQIDKPKNPLKFPYKRPNQYVTSENIENIFRQYLLRKIKAKEISIEDYRLLSEKIKKFRKLAGDKVEALSTVLNKKETAKISSEIIRDLGFDALEISEGTFVTYGLLKTKKLLKDIINQKAGFDPNQQRNDDGTWGSGGQDVENALEALQTLELEDDQVRIPEFNPDTDEIIDKLEPGVFIYGKNSAEIREVGPQELFLLDSDDEIMGFVRLTKNKKQASINLIYLKENFRGYGYGSNFYKYFLDKGVNLKSDSEITGGTMGLYKSLIRQGYPYKIDSKGRVILKPKPRTKDLADVINQKAGFKPGQARDKDGKWADKWAGMKTREQEIKDQKKETALIYDADGNLLQEIGGSETHVEIPLLQDGAHILTHNHPNSSSFSRADILFLTDNDLGSIRAIGPSGNIFEMTLKKEFFGWKSEVLTSWSDAKELADAEVKSYLVESLGEDWETPYWRVNENKVKTAQKVFGRWSDRVNWHLANSTEFGKKHLNYKTYKP